MRMGLGATAERILRDHGNISCSEVTFNAEFQYDVSLDGQGYWGPQRSPSMLLKICTKNKVREIKTGSGGVYEQMKLLLQQNPLRTVWILKTGWIARRLIQRVSRVRVCGVHPLAQVFVY